MPGRSDRKARQARSLFLLFQRGAPGMSILSQELSEL
jgi:hypothetical protein